jgi:chaperonin GroES
MNKSKLKIRPLHDRVVVRREEEEERTAGGIFIPETAKEKPVRGVVLAIGNGKILDNGDTRSLAVKIGDKILFGKYAGTELKLGDDEVLVLREEDILGIIEA